MNRVKQQDLDTTDRPFLVRLRSFVIALAGLVAIIYLSQYPIKLIPAFSTYSDVVDENGFTPGALYYTDVHVTSDAEKFVRKAIVRATPENSLNQMLVAQ